MLAGSLERILASVGPDDRVLDVGGWAAPLNRATHVLDLQPYATRGAMIAGGYGPGPERFTADTWVVRDMCDRAPWPFPDDHFAFSVCVTTLEDVRDPIGVCRELSRVSRAGYVEVPTVLDELTVWLEGPWLGHDHHRWLCEQDADGTLVFLHKPHSVHFDRRLRVTPEQIRQLPDEERLLGLFWEGELAARERIHIDVAFPLDELAESVRGRFPRTAAEERLEAARGRALAARARASAPLRAAVRRLARG